MRLEGLGLVVEGLHLIDQRVDLRNWGRCGYSGRGIGPGSRRNDGEPSEAERRTAAKALTDLTAPISLSLRELFMDLWGVYALGRRQLPGGSKVASSHRAKRVKLNSNSADAGIPKGTLGKPRRTASRLAWRHLLPAASASTRAFTAALALRREGPTSLLIPPCAAGLNTASTGARRK